MLRLHLRILWIVFFGRTFEHSDGFFLFQAASYPPLVRRQLDKTLQKATLEQSNQHHYDQRKEKRKKKVLFSILKF